MSEQNKKIVNRFVEEVESKGNLAVAEELLSTDFVNHTPLGDAHGIEGAKKFGSMLRAAFPDMRMTIEDQIAESDIVATRWKCQGTHQGEFQGLPPTGKKIEITGMTISRVAEGKIVEQWGNPDLLGLMQQLGAVPAS